MSPMTDRGRFDVRAATDPLGPCSEPIRGALIGVGLSVGMWVLIGGLLLQLT